MCRILGKLPDLCIVFTGKKYFSVMRLAVNYFVLMRGLEVGCIIVQRLLVTEPQVACNERVETNILLKLLGNLVNSSGRLLINMISCIFLLLGRSKC